MPLGKACGGSAAKPAKPRAQDFDASLAAVAPALTTVPVKAGAAASAAVAGAAVVGDASAATADRNDKGKKEKKVTKEKKDPCAGSAKIISFFTKKPAWAARPVGNVASSGPAMKLAATTTTTPAADAGTTPIKNGDECILLDSDSEAAAKDGGSTPSTARKLAEAEGMDWSRPTDAVQVAEDRGGNKAAVDGDMTANTGIHKPGSSMKRTDVMKRTEKRADRKKAKTESLNAKVQEEVAKGRQGTLSFQPCAARASTLDMGSKSAVFNSAPLKPKKERPSHPVGAPIQHPVQFVSVLQFCNTFSEPLEIEEVSAQDFDNALTKFPDDVLSQIHMGLLYTILISSKAKDEAHFLDADTWPEMVRMHLDEAGKNSGHDRVDAECLHARELAVAAADYPSLTRWQRLDILEFLVNDCLGTETMKTFIDGRLDRIEALHRQQQEDMLADKYKKEGEALSVSNPQAGHMIAFAVKSVAPANEPTGEDLTLEGKTSRQIALERQREEEMREKKVAEEQRLREEKKLADDLARKKIAKDRKERSEQRSLDLAKANAQVRAPQVHTTTNAYVVVDCLYPGHRRVLFSGAHKAAATINEVAMDKKEGVHQVQQDQVHKTEDPITQTDGAEKLKSLRLHFVGEPEWRLLAVEGKDVEMLLQHYAPAHSEDKGELQRRFRDLIPSPSQPVVSATVSSLCTEAPAKPSFEESVEILSEEKENQEQALAYEGQSLGKNKTDAMEMVQTDDAGSCMAEMVDVQALLLSRVKELILDLDDCTPEDMFTNFQAYLRSRAQWRESVENATSVQDLRVPLKFFEDAMKHHKMKPGWAPSTEHGCQRQPWLEDVTEAASLSQMLYYVKVLTHFIGRRQKARSSLKIASIFTGEMRLTRARAGIVKPSNKSAHGGDGDIELCSDNNENLQDEVEEEEEEEEEEEWVENEKEVSEEEVPRRGSRRSTRVSARSKADGSRGSSRFSQAPVTRKSSRETRPSTRTRGLFDRIVADYSDLQGADSDASSDGSAQKSRPRTRRTRRVSRGACAELGSDSD